MSIQANVTYTSNVAGLLDGLDDKIMRGENKAAERLLGLAVEQIPFDLGTLSDSGAVQPAQNPEDGAAVTFDTPYAKHLHEHPEYNFQNGRKGKYLEDPALENEQELLDIITATVTET